MRAVQGLCTDSYGALRGPIKSGPQKIWRPCLWAGRQSVREISPLQINVSQQLLDKT